MPVKRYDEHGSVVIKIADGIRRHPEGIWLAELARTLKMPAPTVHYLIFGRLGQEGHYGGYLRASVERIKQGRNVMIRWKQ